MSHLLHDKSNDHCREREGEKGECQLPHGVVGGSKPTKSRLVEARVALRREGRG